MKITTLLPLLATLHPILAAPEKPDFANTTTLPTHYGLLLFPHFQALDVFGPMDVFNSLTMQYGNVTNMQLSILSRTMDPVSTAMKGMHGDGNFGQAIVPTTTFSEYLARGKTSKEYLMPEDGLAKRQHDHMPMPGADKGDIEVLIVPGGGGTRQNMTEEIAFVKDVYPSLKYIISVCTGATILSRAGILDGKRATTNKRAWPWATSTGPNVTWVPTARWVADGNIWSSSGISAGIDVTYAWVSHVYGEEVAEYMALSSEYERETDEHHDPFGKIWDVPGAS